MKIFILASALTLTLAFKAHQPTVPLSYKDTVKPAYGYFIRVNISVPEYLFINRIKDSIISAYRSEMGDKTIRMYYEHEDYLRNRAVLDSVKILGVNK